MCAVAWSGHAWPWGTWTQRKGQCPSHMQSQAHHHPMRPGATKATRVEGLHQPCREPVACRLPVPLHTLGPSKVPHSGLVQVRGPLYRNKGIADAHRPLGPTWPTPGHVEPRALMAQTDGTSSIFPNPPATSLETLGTTCAHKDGQNSPGPHAQASPQSPPVTAAPPPHSSHSCGSPRPPNLFAQHLKQPRHPTPSHPRAWAPPCVEGLARASPLGLWAGVRAAGAVAGRT